MKLFASMLAASLAMSASMAMAQTETETTTTTVQTTTTTDAPAFVLPATGSYYVVNPSNGVVVGNYVQGMTLSPGYYVVERSSGRAFASVDVSGKLIGISAVPTVIPQRFLAVNGQLVYFSNEYAYRRAQLDAQIAANYSAGKLTNRQVKDLRDDLAYISSLENKRKGDGTYSRSTMRDIERKFAEVQSDLNGYIADTNERKAKLGIKVD